MESAILSYKGTSSTHLMNIIAGYKGKDDSIFLIREGLNNSIYKLSNLDSLDLHYGIGCSLKLSKKVLEVQCGEKFKFKGKSYRKFTRSELVEIFKDKIFNPIKVDK